MLLDSKLQFSDHQKPLAVKTHNSDNIIDIGPFDGNAYRNIGAGAPLHLLILVTEAFTTTGANAGARLSLSLVSSATEDLASSTVHWSSGAARAVANLGADVWIAKGVPIPSVDYKRYLGIHYGTSVKVFSGGAISAWLHYGSFDETTMRVAGAPGSTNVRI